MTTVRTPLGDIEGTAFANHERYAGIRYAKAPVGELRFRAPLPVEPWDGVYDATTFGAVAPQAAGALGGLMGQRDISKTGEDCLFLNVYTPRADGGRRPVMVWIHGGAYIFGSGDVYDGKTFCERGDVVVVTINYRLGTFGFLPLDALDPSYAGAGNNGIRDQIEALRWVRDNIACFGGDPTNVTIFGESAGGGSVMALQAAPDAGGLFHKAIAQSPPTGFGEPHLAAEMCKDIIAALGEGSTLDTLLAATTDEILDAQAKVSAAGIRVAVEEGAAIDRGSGKGFHPVVDGVVIHQPVAEVLATKGASAVPLLTGTNLDEGTLFAMLLPSFDDDELVARLSRDLPDAKAVVRVHRERASGDRSIAADLFTESVFRIPTLQAADALADAGGRVWLYQFTWATPVFGGRLGATHALEIPFVWGLLDQWGAFLGGEAPRELAIAMQDAWLAFARTGNPNAAGLPEWPPYDTTRRPTLEFGAEVRVVDDPVGDVRRAWYGEA